LRRNGGRNEASDADLHLEVNEEVLGDVEAAINGEYGDGGDEDADDDHPLSDLRDDNEEGSEDDPERSGAEEGMFVLDEEGAVNEGELPAGDEDDIHSDEDFSSGSADFISGEHETDDQNQDMNGPTSFGVDQFRTSLQPVELDHDTLAHPLGNSPSLPQDRLQVGAVLLRVGAHQTVVEADSTTEVSHLLGVLHSFGVMMLHLRPGCREKVLADDPHSTTEPRFPANRTDWVHCLQSISVQVLNGRHESVVESRKTDKDLNGVELRNVYIAEVLGDSSSSTRRSSTIIRRQDRESAVRADACINRQPEVAS
jgi:hypothetical protein